MNVYDFDETIYDGDCTTDFLLLCLTKPKCLGMMILQSYNVILYALHIIDKTTMKHRFFSFLKCIDDIDGMLEPFFKKNIKKIKPYYLAQQRDDDVIISASPLFLVKGFTDQIGIKDVYGTAMDKHTGEIEGVNCKKEAKVVLFRKYYGDAVIDEFYSDSKSDNPLAKEAKKAILVKKDKLLPWPKEWLAQ